MKVCICVCMCVCFECAHALYDEANPTRLPEVKVGIVLHEQAQLPHPHGDGGATTILEQSVSVDFHRYGHMGLRELTESPE